MKRLVTFALALVCSMGSVLLAQEKSPYVVTLEHEGELQTFYGTTGFEAAYNAASDGDVITLPAQTYYNWDNDGITIKKAVTIKGTHSDGGRTKIQANVYLSLPQSNTGTIYLEGLDIFDMVFECSNVNVSKCNVETMFSPSKSSSPTIIRCQIGRLVFGLLSPTIFNSVIKDTWMNDDQAQQAGTTTCVNCVFDYTIGSEKLFVMNCILAFGCATFPSTATPMFCLDCGSSFQLIPDAYSRLNNKEVTPGENPYEPNTYYQLTEEAKATYLGDDGTEVGIYGGQYPWNDTLSTPTITNLNVSKRVAQGETLKIDVEAE